MGWEPSAEFEDAGSDDSTPNFTRKVVDGLVAC